MCGRFVSVNKKKIIEKSFNISTTKNFLEKSYNVAPGQKINAILNNNKELILDSLNWGYSFYSKKNNKDQTIINSRIETINSKFLFKDSFLKRKCIILANGYYEWQKTKNKKIPYFINIPELESIFFAGIWRIENRNNIKTPVCCIITKEANKKITFIHHRMPIIFSFNEALLYLNDTSNEFSKNIKNSEIEDELDFYEVSTIVNNPLNNYKKCIEPMN